ncbi:DUF1837 domain-containing protein [Vibrio cholerae]|uniref:HamA C-terminal domain-containing protein n=1 Tax=Vibrio cholerae TaxID=666 RepID=UPI0011D3E74F|nr:DUF1837 domain-containing protein [Vibrio cholerae]EHE0025760.1 DUF1837 domain-containing protein [Vibrio cholerae]MCX9566881.1 DUF1837 domain-containing protein [Vibrio cholerae]MCX9570421.1 DUF1837 domain-containing protein [Vibrio cholerae]MCX9587524.1 DUF1837 domain-containing protein [Vibrio cholerae]TXX81708.1 DUF1837 domain-containing protein [Vibrio cholerae]
MDFEILIDSSFSEHCSSKSISPIHNKYVLSLVNDFEDGKWRFKHFQNFIWDNIAETSLSITERQALVDQSHSLLTAAAENLRLVDKDQSKDISKGSELAEILLYGIMKHHYGALPVVPKIFYKQNTQDNAKGADSVHLVIKDNDFTVWFGEAKFYNKIEDARLASIVSSVANSLDTKKLKKENSIITNVNDIDFLIEDETLRKSIRDALSCRISIDSLKPKIHVPIFILHECEITRSCTRMDSDYINEIKDYHIDRANAFFKKQIEGLKGVHLYDQVTFHIILFPVPDKQRIVDRFVRKVEQYKEDD